MGLSDRIGSIESLRAIAALSVMGFHAAFLSGLAGSDSALSPYASRLEAGVAIFFLISGFLLYRPFVRARLEPGAPAPSLARYGVSRVLRIVPAYWLALAVIAVWLGLEGVFGWPGMVTYFGFLQAYSPATFDGGLLQAWSLGVEVCFYAALPIYAWLVGRLPATTLRARLRNEWVGVASLLALGVVWNAAALVRLDPATDAAQPYLLSLPAYLDQFALGIGLAVLSVARASAASREGPVTRLVDRFPGVGVAVALVALWAVSTQIGLQGGPELIGDQEWIARHLLFSVIALGLMLPAVVGTPGRGLTRRALELRPLRWVGVVSYGVFLWHLAVLLQMDRWDFNPPGGAATGWLIWLAVAGGPVLALAACSWYGVERPALRLRGRAPRPPPGASRRHEAAAEADAAESLAAP